MFRKYFVLFLLIIVPQIVFAIDFGRGLLESQDNLGNRDKFLIGGANLRINPPDLYPIPLFGRIAGGSIKFNSKINKESYKTGENIQIQITATNEGFVNDNTTPVPKTPANIKKFYLWAGGNFLVGIYRLSEEVKGGEYLVASGKAFPENDISLYQKETKEFKVDWKIPDNAKAGTYEIRIFPTSKNLLFAGTPEAYRTFMMSRLKIESNIDTEEKVSLKLSELKLREDTVRLKEKMIRLNAEGNYSISLPIENLGENPKELMIIKQFQVPTVVYGTVDSKETEKIFLKPKETKIINYNINKSNIKNHSKGVAAIYFIDAKDERLLGPNGISYANYPISNVNLEGVEIPLYFIGNVDLRVLGMGTIIIGENTVFKKESFLNYFMEVERLDRLFYETGEKERAKEENISLSLTLLDKNGGTVDRVGYDGPSWDRSGQVSKTIQLEKDYNYLKLVGVLSSKGGGELQRSEIEYFTPERPAASWLDRAKEMVGNRMILTIASVVALTILSIGTVVLIARKRRKDSSISIK